MPDRTHNGVTISMLALDCSLAAQFTLMTDFASVCYDSTNPDEEKPLIRVRHQSAIRIVGEMTVENLRFDGLDSRADDPYPLTPLCTSISLQS